MAKVLVTGENPALRLAKAKAAKEFITTKRVLQSGSYKSESGSFPLSRATHAPTSAVRKIGTMRQPR